jgi:hypothetical protein
MPRHNLEDGADGIADETECDGPLAAELVAKGEGKDGAAEGTELDSRTRKLISSIVIYGLTYCKTTGRNSGNAGLLGLGEPVLEVGWDQHAREDALVVAEPRHGGFGVSAWFNRDKKRHLTCIDQGDAGNQPIAAEAVEEAHIGCQEGRRGMKIVLWSS